MSDCSTGVADPLLVWFKKYGTVSQFRDFIRRKSLFYLHVLGLFLGGSKIDENDISSRRDFEKVVKLNYKTSNNCIIILDRFHFHKNFLNK